MSATSTARLPSISSSDLPQWVEWLYAYGLDTVDIGEVLDLPEADVCRMLAPRRGEVREPWAAEASR